MRCPTHPLKVFHSDDSLFMKMRATQEICLNLSMPWSLIIIRFTSLTNDFVYVMY